MRKLLLIVSFVFLTCNNIHAQKSASSSTDRCGSVFDEAKVKKHSPDKYQQWLRMEKQIETYVNRSGTNTNQRVSDPSVTVTIPVVVHVVYNNAAQNISDAQIQSQIDVLNEDYRRLNADRINTPGQFAAIAANVNIEFKLACLDPQGNTTNGIVRIPTTNTGFNFAFKTDGTADDVAIGLKYVSGAQPWPTNTYLNIWTCNFLDNTLGYATFPWERSTVDGVVLAYNATGRTGTLQARYDKGRTATHEVGHWLDLIHIWGDDDGADINGLG